MVTAATLTILHNEEERRRKTRAGIKDEGLG